MPNCLENDIAKAVVNRDILDLFGATSRDVAAPVPDNDYYDEEVPGIGYAIRVTFIVAFFFVPTSMLAALCCENLVNAAMFCLCLPTWCCCCCCWLSVSCGRQFFGFASVYDDDSKPRRRR